MSPPTRSQIASSRRTIDLTRSGRSPIAAEASPRSSGGLFGYAIASEVPLSRLGPEPGSRGTIRIELAHGALSKRTGALLAAFEPDPPHAASYALARTETGALLTCSVTGTFLIEGAARRVIVEPARCSPAQLEHRLVATAIPLLAAELGDLVLHASAVVADDAAILFCGPSGRGKSTIALALAEAGMPLLSEDGAVVTLRPAALGWPGPLGVRVSAAVAAPGATPSTATDVSGIRLVVPSRRQPRPVPIGAVVMLEPRGGPRAHAEPVRPADAVPGLVPEVIAADSPHLPSLFARAARIADTLPVWRGRMPDDLAGARRAAADLVEILVRDS